MNKLRHLVKSLDVSILPAFAVIALMLFTTTATADGPASCSFSGTVKVDGAEVAGGTLVTAIVEGYEYHTHTPPGLGSSSYSITIQPPEGRDYPDGTVVTFKINGYRADQTGIFQAGSNIRLELTASTGSVPTSATPPAPLNVPLIVGVILALLVAGGTTYYFVRLRRATIGITANERDRLTRGQHSSPRVHPKEVPNKPSEANQQLRKAEIDKKVKFEQPIVYPDGVLKALAIHSFPLQRTTPVNLPVRCPACHQQFRIWVPDSWTVTRRAHVADGIPSYGKRTRSKWLFEFDVVCPEGHKLHLDWNWRPSAIPH